MLILIRGAGDIASGIALRLWRCGFDIVMTELAAPTAIRRTVCFSEAVRLGKATVENVEAVLVQVDSQIAELLQCNKIPVLVDPDGNSINALSPDAVVDARLAKRNIDTAIDDAPVVIGVGPGFTAGVDCHAVVETSRGHYLGRVIREGGALPNTGIPGNIGGYTTERILRAPAAGIFTPVHDIGDTVSAGETVGFVNGVPMMSAIGGTLRGILPGKTPVTKGMKSGDVDPRCQREHCFCASDKALAVGGGVLEALLALTAGRR